MSWQEVINASNKCTSQICLLLVLYLIIGLEWALLNCPQHHAIVPAYSHCVVVIVVVVLVAVRLEGTDTPSTLQHAFISTIKARVELVSQFRPRAPMLGSLIVALKHAQVHLR